MPVDGLNQQQQDWLQLLLCDACVQPTVKESPLEVIVLATGELRL